MIKFSDKLWELFDRVWDLLEEPWLPTWILLTIASSLLSFIGSWGYFFFLAFLFPLAQVIGLFRIKRTIRNLIWLLHIPFWFYVLGLKLNPSQIWIAIFINSILGEILLTFIFQKFSRFTWTIANGLALGIIYGAMQFYTMNDFVQTVVIIISYGVAAIITGFGLVHGYLMSKERTTTPHTTDN